MKKCVFLDRNKCIANHTRLIFMHPDDNSKCIKIIDKNQYRNFFKKFRPISYRNENLTEIKEYKTIKNENCDFIPKFYGIVNTNLGKGICVEFIKHSYNIREYINKYGMSEDLLMLLKNTFKKIIKFNIGIKSFHHSNYIVKYCDKKKAPISVYAVDLGISLAIPLDVLSLSFKRKRIISRLKKTINKLMERYPENCDLIKKIMVIDELK